MKHPCIYLPKRPLPFSILYGSTEAPGITPSSSIMLSMGLRDW